MKCIIAGPRDYDDADKAFALLDKIFSNKKPDTVLSGGASGMDHIGEMWAGEYNIPVEIYPVTKEDWDKHGRSAGPKRNELMATKATHCVVIWQGKSPGSRNMLATAKKHNLIIREVLL